MQVLQVAQRAANGYEVEVMQAPCWHCRVFEPTFHAWIVGAEFNLLTPTRIVDALAYVRAVLFLCYPQGLAPWATHRDLFHSRA